MVSVMDFVQAAVETQQGAFIKICEVPVVLSEFGARVPVVRHNFVI